MHFGHLIHLYGLVVVAGVIGLECVGLPFPGETVLILAAVFAGTQHDLNIVEVIVTAMVAASVGQLAGYLIGIKFGYWLLLRYGSYLRITESRIKLGEYLFLRHGSKIVVASRFIPVLRCIAGILAGANRMPLRSFLIANVGGAIIWALSFGISAYFLGKQVERLAGWLFACVCLVVAAVLIVAGMFVRRHEAQLAAEAERALPGPLRYP